MKILHVTDTMDYASGVRRYVEEASGLFRSRGHAVDVWSPPGIGDDVSSLVTRWLGFRYCTEFRRVLRDGCYDVLHAHNMSMRLSPLPLREARALGVPVVMTVHDFGLVCPRKWMIRPRGDICEYGFGWRCLVSDCRSSRPGRLLMPYHNLRWLKTALHRTMLRRYVSLFVSPSAMLRDWLAQSSRGVRVEHIPNFVALGAAPECHGPCETMVYVGRLSAEKGVDVLLRAVALVAAKRPNASLKIVGDGPERKNLEYLAAMLYLQDRVAFAGEQDAAAVGRTLREAALAVLPSLWVENCPMVALEALAAGTPVIGVRVGGIPDLIREGETGELFERGSARDLADTMVRALGDARWLRESRQRARHSAETEFSPERHYDRLMEIYESVIHRARK